MKIMTQPSLKRMTSSVPFGSIAVGLVLAFVASGVVIFLSGRNPLVAFQGIALGAFGNPFVFALTLVRATPIILTSLGTIISFRTSIWNVGQEGQLYIGALAGTWTVLAFPNIPSFALVPMGLLMGILFGAAWSGIAGFLYVFFQADAVIVTIMLNYIALLVVDLAITGPIRDPSSLGNPISPEIPSSAILPIILPQTLLHAGFLVAIVSPFIVYVLLTKTTLGYRIRAIGFNRDAARYAGIDSLRTTLIVFLLTGAFCGLAGAIEVQGFQFRLIEGISPGYGNMGVISSLLGGLSPIGVVFSSLFMAALLNGTQNTSITIGLSTFLVTVLQGITIICVLALTSGKMNRLLRKRK